MPHACEKIDNTDCSAYGHLQILLKQRVHLSLQACWSMDARVDQFFIMSCAFSFTKWFFGFARKAIHSGWIHLD